MSLPTGIKSIERYNGTNGSINISYTDTVNKVTYYAGEFKNIILSDNTNMDASNIFGINNNTNQIFRLGIPSYNGTMDPYGPGNIDNIYVDTRNNILYVIGVFRYVNDKTTTTLNLGYSISYFATWDITNSVWIKPGLGTDFNDVISTSIFDEDKKLIYIGGSFRDRSINSYFTIYDMTAKIWKANMRIYVNTRVLALYYDKPKNNLYVGGSFTKVGYTPTDNITAYRIAILNTNTFTWSVLGSVTSNGVDNFQPLMSPDNEVNAFLSYNNNLLNIRGYFSKVYDSYGVKNSLVYQLDGNNNMYYTTVWDTVNNKWSSQPSSTTNITVPVITTTTNTRQLTVLTYPPANINPNTTAPVSTTKPNTIAPVNTTKPNTTSPFTTTIPNTTTPFTTTSTTVPLISENYTFITSLRVPASKGDTKIYVEDDSKFKIGDVIQIGTSDITIAKVIGFGSLLLDTPLKFDYNGKVPVGIIAAEDNKKPIDYTIYIIIAVVIVIIICSSSLVILNK